MKVLKNGQLHKVSKNSHLHTKSFKKRPVPQSFKKRPSLHKIFSLHKVSKNSQLCKVLKNSHLHTKSLKNGHLHTNVFKKQPAPQSFKKQPDDKLIRAANSPVDAIYTDTVCFKYDPEFETNEDTLDGIRESQTKARRIIRSIEDDKGMPPPNTMRNSRFTMMQRNRCYL